MRFNLSTSRMFLLWSYISLCRGSVGFAIPPKKGRSSSCLLASAIPDIPIGAPILADSFSKVMTTSFSDASSSPVIHDIIVKLDVTQNGLFYLGFAAIIFAKSQRQAGFNQANEEIEKQIANGEINVEEVVQEIKLEAEAKAAKETKKIAKIKETIAVKMVESEMLLEQKKKTEAENAALRIEIKRVTVQKKANAKEVMAKKKQEAVENIKSKKEEARKAQKAKAEGAIAEKRERIRLRQEEKLAAINVMKRKADGQKLAANANAKEVVAKKKQEAVENIKSKKEEARKAQKAKVEGAIAEKRERIRLRQEEKLAAINVMKRKADGQKLAANAAKQKKDNEQKEKAKEELIASERNMMASESNDTKQEEEVSTESSIPNASPMAVKIGEDNGLDLSLIAGTGKGGQITYKDMIIYMKAPQKTVDNFKTEKSGEAVKVIADETETKKPEIAVKPIADEVNEHTEFQESIPESIIPEETIAEVLPSINISPVARILAKEMGIDIDLVQGTGRGGRILADDVKNFAEPAIKNEAGNEESSVVFSDEAVKVIADESETKKPEIAVKPIADEVNEHTEFQESIPESVIPEETIAEVLPSINISPVARILAREMGIDIELVQGTGRGGRILADDVKNFAEPAIKTEAGNEESSVVFSAVANALAKERGIDIEHVEGTVVNQDAPFYAEFEEEDKADLIGNETTHLISKAKANDTWNTFSDSKLKRKTVKELSEYLVKRGVVVTDSYGNALRKAILVTAVKNTSP